MTRRAVLAALGVPPAVAVAQDCLFLPSNPVQVRCPEIGTTPPVDQEAVRLATQLIREIYPMGDLGRGKLMSLREIKRISGVLPSMGFKPYSLGLTTSFLLGVPAEFFPVYGSGGAPCTLAWCAWTREVDGKYQAVAMEYDRIFGETT